MAEPSELNLWTRQWRDERIRKARADFRERDAAWQCLNGKETDYARSLKMARDVCAQVLAVWEASPVDLPEDESGVDTSAADRLAAALRAYVLLDEQRGNLKDKLYADAQAALAAYGVAVLDSQPFSRTDADTK